MELLQELFVTAFVALIFSFFFAKLVSIATITSGDARRDLRLEKSSANVRGERVVKEAKFNRVLPVRSSKSKGKVRFAEESVRELDDFEGFEDKRCDSAVICDAPGRIEAVEVVRVSVGSSDKRFTEAAEIVGETEVEIKEVDAVTNLNGLVAEEGSEGKKAGDIGSVINEGNVTVDLLSEESYISNEFEEKLCVSALSFDLAGRINVVEVGGLPVDLSEEQLTRESAEVAEIVGGPGADVIKEEDIVSDLDDLVVEKGRIVKEADDVENVAIKEEDAITNLEGLAAEQGSEGEETDDIESDIKEDDTVIKLDGLGVKEGCEGKEVEDLECSFKEGIEITDLVFKEKILENVEFDMNVESVCVRDDIVVVQDVESGIELGLNMGDVKDEQLVGDEEDDWEGIERSELDEVFTAAAKYFASGGKDNRLANVGSDLQMQFYVLHKVAMEGPCHEPQPMALKISSRAKWNAWQRMGNMNPEVAMEQYIALLSDIVPGWKEGKSYLIQHGDDNAFNLESGLPAAPHSDICTDSANQRSSMKKRELENSGSDGGV